MSSFNEIYENALSNIITEGGNAIANVSRIKKEDIRRTVSSFKKQILIPYIGEDPGEYMFLLGSTGKKKDSGDIDIGIDMEVFKDKNILTNLIRLDEACAKNGINSCINTINYDMLHVAYPQSGHKNKFVQIDVLLTNSPEFVKFYMSSPSEKESKYKGAHRNALLRAILSAISFKPTAYDENDEPVKWEQIDLSESGLYKQYKTLIDINGNRILYKNTNEPLEFFYAKVERQFKISNNVSYIIKYVVGSKYTEEDINTFEKLFDIVRNDTEFRYSIISNKILCECAKILKQSENRLVFPEELKPYLKK